MEHQSSALDPNPGYNVVTFTDKILLACALLSTPWYLTTFTIHRICNVGHNDLPLLRGLLLWLARGLSRHIPLSINRALLKSNGSGVLNSTRFRNSQSNIHEAPIRRADFSGQWLCKGSPGKLTPPKSCDLVVYYMHGGGYRVGTPDSMLVVFLRIAELLASHNITLAVFSLDYSLTPEATFPTPINQAVCGYRYLIEEAEVSPSNLAIMGDSAGGHLALCLATMLQKHNLPSPRAGAFLICPWIDILCSNATKGSYKSNETKDFIIASDLAVAGAMVLGSSGLDHLVDFSQPLPEDDDGKRRSWKDILSCKVWMSAGSDEIFLDDILRFADRLTTGGVDVVVDVTEGKFHAWQAFADSADQKRYLATPGPDCPEGLMAGSKNIADGILAVLGKR